MVAFLARAGGQRGTRLSHCIARAGPAPGVLRGGAMFEPLTRDFGGYIFDCDGTLADSMVVHHRAWLAALHLHGATFDFDWELFTSRAGMSLPKTVEALNEQFALAMDPVAVTAAQR